MTRYTENKTFNQLMDRLTSILQTGVGGILFVISHRRFNFLMYFNVIWARGAPVKAPNSAYEVSLDGTLYRFNSRLQI